MVTTYEKAGIKKGREQGIEQGIEKGKLEMLLFALEKRFAKLPGHIRRKVLQISSSQRIEDIMQAILEGKSLSELGL